MTQAKAVGDVGSISKMLAILCCLLLIFQVFEGVGTRGVTKDKPKCAKMVVPMSNNIFGNTSNETSVPTRSQKNLEKEIISHFTPLGHMNCSHFTLLFVCLSHLPFCSLSHTDLPALLPCCPVCHHVYNNCIHHFNLHLRWPQHLNCSKFPGYPKLWIKPPSSSPVPPTAASTQNVSSFHFISSCSRMFSTTISPQLMTSHTDSDSDTFYSKFIWFLADFLPKLVSSLYIVFIFVCFSFFVPLGLFVSYVWWLRFRVERPGLKKIPLREILGPLPLIPEL